MSRQAGRLQQGWGEGSRPGIEASVRGPSLQRRCRSGGSGLAPPPAAWPTDQRTGLSPRPSGPTAQAPRAAGARRGRRGAGVASLPASDAAPAPRPTGKGRARLRAAWRLPRWKRSEAPVAAAPTWREARGGRRRLRPGSRASRSRARSFSSSEQLGFHSCFCHHG